MWKMAAGDIWIPISGVSAPRSQRPATHLALKMFLLLYVSCLALTRWYYMRKSFLVDLALSLAAARV
jgi:hypothetical protein